MKFSHSLVSLLLLLIICSCKKSVREDINVEVKNEFPLFTSLDSKDSGISFSNNLKENDSLNYFTYGYIYMGGGISAGDINNDGLIDLYFTGNMVSNKLYLNKGNFQFEDITSTAGIAGDDRWYTGTTMVDINHDGYLDIYCSVSGKFGSRKNQLFINNQDNTFTEQAAAYGIADTGYSIQSTFFDYDLDGDLDLYIANYPPTPFNASNQYYSFKKYQAKLEMSDRLYRNDGQKFVDVTKEAGVKDFGLSISATVGDLNRDGWPDIYVSNDFSSPDLLYINQKDGTFKEKVKESTDNTSFYGMGVDIADFNNDLLLDFFQVDMDAKDNRRSKANMASMNPALFWSTVNSGFHYQYMQNSLQLNNGVFSENLPDFSNISRIAGTSSSDWSWSPLFADLDNDGWKDLFVTNGTRREINNKDFFSKDNLKKFEENTLEKTLKMPSEKIKNFVYHNDADLTFTDMRDTWGIDHKGFSNGSVYVDLDNDGDLDLVTNNIDDTASVYKNNNNDRNNYITVEFQGDAKNTVGIGVKVTITTANNKQFQEMTLTRGFQSSVAPRLHFGLGKHKTIDTLKIVWPDRKEQILTDIQSNQLLQIHYVDAKATISSETETFLAFSKLEDSSFQIPYVHKENRYDDFKKQVLLPHQLSRLGPFMGTGDLNGDQLDDVIIGGAINSSPSVYFQKTNGFKKQENTGLEKDTDFEDMGIAIFDVEGDGDNDIYIVSGGYEYEPDSDNLQDRLYINQGNGKFEKNTQALPDLRGSGLRVKPFDFDKDGDLDLFVGGRQQPGNYPLPGKSYILENTSTKEDPKFVDVTEMIAPGLSAIGMVTDASWMDINEDDQIDLVIVGEWMPITVFLNENGSFQNRTKEMGLEDTTGWWFSIAEGDFDKDGDVDMVAGNLGLNFKYKATEKETFDIYFNDFDQNNSGDIVLSYFNGGKKYPVRGRECSSQQIPAIKKKFKDYASYSIATLEDVYTEKDLENSLHYQVKSFASVYLENKNGKFEIHELPKESQLFNINDFVVKDVNNDSNLDIIAAGNLYAAEVETPRNDAGKGLMLLGDGSGNFKTVPARESGLFVKGDVKDMSTLKVKGEEYLLFAKNSDALEMLKMPHANSF